MASETLTASVAAYTHRLMTTLDRSSASAVCLVQWLKYNQGKAGIDFGSATATKTKSGRMRRVRTVEKPLSERAWSQLTDALNRKVSAGLGPASVMDRNFNAFTDTLDLTPLQREVFRFVFLTDIESAFGRLCERLVSNRAYDSAGLIAACLGRDDAQVQSALIAGSLRTMGLVDVCFDGFGRFGYFVPYEVRRALTTPLDGLAAVESALIGDPLKPTLGWGDFEYIGRDLDFLERLLRGALDQRATGINILFYGPPGTGKTELCKTLANRVDAHLFAVGECDEDGQEPTRSERIDALRRSELLTSRRDRAMLLFDEMEDILKNGDRVTYEGRTGRRAGSKTYFNRLLERNRVPVLWTANGVYEFDPAFLRRMSFILEMKTPRGPVRTRLWKELAEKRRVPLSAGDARHLGERYRVTPSFMSSALTAVSLAKGGAEDVDFAVHALSKPIIGRPLTAKTRDGNAHGFRPDLVNTQTDLGDLVRSLAKPAASRAVSLCLYGAPGTGKSAFARYLAHEMGIDVLEKRASDLMSKWVGETEQFIAAAFEEAVEDERMLIIDEADSLFWSRSGAGKSWEVSMVNELLSQMDEHPLPFVCTTNLLDRMDPAALRRFVFKVEFDFLTQVQAGTAFELFFGRPAPADLGRLRNLTPSDFATVARKLRFFGEEGQSEARIMTLLTQELAVKPGQMQRIGF